MRIVDKHLFREYLGPFACCLAAFCMLYVVQDLFDRMAKILEADVGAGRVLAFYVDYLLSFNGGMSGLVAILPASLLLGAVYALTQLSRHNELTAMQASGLSFARLMRPFIAVGLIASVAGLAAQELAAPACTRRMEAFDMELSGRRPAELSKDFAYFNVTAGRRWLIRSFDPQVPHRLQGVRVTEERPDGTVRRQVEADSAEWLDGTWWLRNVTVRTFDENGDPAAAPVEKRGRPIEMRELTDTPASFAREVHGWESYSAREMRAHIRARPFLSARERARLLTDFHSRLAFPWTCLIVTLLAVPAAARGNRQNMIVRVAFCIGLFFCFYALMHIGIFLGKRDAIWPWLAAWLPNIVFAGLGIRLMAGAR